MPREGARPAKIEMRRATLSRAPTGELTDAEKSAITIDAIDYNRCRDEIDKRSALSAQLLSFDLVIVGAVLGGYDKLPKESLILIACVPCLFWLMWIDHTSQIYKLAAYLELVVAPRIRAIVPDSLRWEAFLRELDQGGPSAARALGLPPAAPAGRAPIPRTEGINNYIGILFGGSVLVLAGVYLVLVGFESVGRIYNDTLAAAWQDLAKLLLALPAVALFVYCVVMYARLNALCATIAQQVRAAGRD